MITLIELTDRVLTRRGTCDYCYPESSWGRCDGGFCGQEADISDTETSYSYCRKHWKEITQ